jgi:Family of unknown function (DUF6455)
MAMGSVINRSAERRAIRMHQMIGRLEIDPVALTRLDRGEVYAKARSKCLSCATIADCLRWLDSCGFERESPDFCPNFRTFSALRDSFTPGPAGRRDGHSGSPLAA